MKTEAVRKVSSGVVPELVLTLSEESSEGDDVSLDLSVSGTVLS